MRHRRGRLEQLFETVPRDFQAREGHSQLRGDITNDVVHAFVAQAHAKLGANHLHVEASSAKLRGKLGHIVVDLDTQALGSLREGRD
jgi:hypothetical protein